MPSSSITTIFTNSSRNRLFATSAPRPSPPPAATTSLPPPPTTTTIPTIATTTITPTIIDDNRRIAGGGGTTTSTKKWDVERFARTFSNVMIIAGVAICLGMAVAAVGDVGSSGEGGTIVFLLLVPTFFGGGCLLTLVNISWLSRKPNQRCSLIQLACNIVLLLLTLYVELLFWSYQKQIAFAILFGAAIPMFVFINIPSIFMIPEFDDDVELALAAQFDGITGDNDTVLMEDDEHSLFFENVVVDVECGTGTTGDGSAAMNNTNPALVATMTGQQQHQEQQPGIGGEENGEQREQEEENDNIVESTSLDVVASEQENTATNGTQQQLLPPPNSSTLASPMSNIDDNNNDDDRPPPNDIIQQRQEQSTAVHYLALHESILREDKA